MRVCLVSFFILCIFCYIAIVIENITFLMIIIFSIVVLSLNQSIICSTIYNKNDIIIIIIVDIDNR